MCSLCAVDLVCFLEVRHAGRYLHAPTFCVCWGQVGVQKRFNNLTFLCSLVASAYARCKAIEKAQFSRARDKSSSRPCMTLGSATGNRRGGLDSVQAMMRYCGYICMVKVCLPQGLEGCRQERGALGYLWPSSRSGGTKISAQGSSVTGWTPSS